MADVTEAVRVEWTPAVRRINNQFPTAIRSKHWPEIARLANSGEVGKAEELASRGLNVGSIRRRTAVGRRMRIERMALFSRIAKGQTELRVIFKSFAVPLGKAVEKKATGQKGLPGLVRQIDDVAVDLRREIKKWLRQIISDSTRLGLKNSGDALLPIFKDNREATEGMLSEIEVLEAGLVIGLNTTFARRTDPRAKLKNKKWVLATRRVMRTITKSTLAGLKLSDRVWEITQRVQQDLKRIVTNGVARGDSSFNISKKVQKHLSPQMVSRAELGLSLPPGVYRSPFRNAMRLARTEANRAYTHASAEFAKGKSWVQGIQITLSPAHSHTDICDDWAGKVVTPEKFQNLVPFHPHCMCFATYVLKDNVLDPEKEAA